MIHVNPIDDVAEAEAETLEALSEQFADRVEATERNYCQDR